VEPALTLTFFARVSAEEFGEEERVAFASALADALGCELPACRLGLRVTAASLRIDALIYVSDGPALDAARASATALTATNLRELGETLGGDPDFFETTPLLTEGDSSARFGGNETAGLAAEPETGLLTPAVLIGAVAVIVVVLCVGVMVCCTLCRKKRRRPENMYPASTVAWRDPTRQDSGRNSKAALNSGGFEMVSSSTRASSASNGNGGEPYGRTTLDRIRRKKNDGPAVVHISLQDSGGDTEMSDLRI
jgi:hypothetical protein